MAAGADPVGRGREVFSAAAALAGDVGLLPPSARGLAFACSFAVSLGGCVGLALAVPVGGLRTVLAPAPGAVIFVAADAAVLATDRHPRLDSLARLWSGHPHLGFDLFSTSAATQHPQPWLQRRRPPLFGRVKLDSHHSLEFTGAVGVMDGSAGHPIKAASTPPGLLSEHRN